MIYLAANNSRVRHFAALGYPLGWIFSPAGFRDPRGLTYAVDNGAFYDPAKGERWLGMKLLPAFYGMLRRVAEISTPPLFVAVPDVPYDMARSRGWSAFQAAKIRRAWPGFKLAVVLQEGATDDDLDGYDWSFVGGGTEWKWRTADRWVAASHERGMRCHIGRVNTWPYIQHCIDIGADSADGTGIWRGDQHQLATVLASLVQPGLFGQRQTAGAVHGPPAAVADRV